MQTTPDRLELARQHALDDAGLFPPSEYGEIGQVADVEPATISVWPEHLVSIDEHRRRSGRVSEK